jgi:hypothetical protein
MSKASTRTKSPPAAPLDIHEPLTRHTLRSGVCKGSPLRSDRLRGAARP